MRRLKSASGIALALVLIALFWVGLFWLGNLGDQPCDPNAYDHCGQVGAPGPGGR